MHAFFVCHLYTVLCARFLPNGANHRYPPHRRSPSLSLIGQPSTGLIRPCGGSQVSTRGQPARPNRSWPSSKSERPGRKEDRMQNAPVFCRVLAMAETPETATAREEDKRLCCVSSPSPPPPRCEGWRERSRGGWQGGFCAVAGCHIMSCFMPHTQVGLPEAGSLSLSRRIDRGFHVSHSPSPPPHLQVRHVFAEPA